MLHNIIHSFPDIVFRSFSDPTNFGSAAYEMFHNNFVNSFDRNGKSPCNPHGAYPSHTVEFGENEQNCLESFKEIVGQYCSCQYETSGQCGQFKKKIKII